MTQQQRQSMRFSHKQLIDYIDQLEARRETCMPRSIETIRKERKARIQAIKDMKREQLGVNNL